MGLVRPAVRADADAIARVHIDSWRTTYRGLLSDDVLDNLSLERRREWWQSILGGPQQTDVVVVEENEGVVGFSFFGEEREHDPVYRGELYAIYLLRDYQQRGLGRLLVVETARGLLKRGLNNMIVWVLSTNPARRFYEKIGGTYLRDKVGEIGGCTMQESAYGWTGLQPLAELK